MENCTNAYPLGIQTFSTLRKDGYIYIDKTWYIQQILTNKSKDELTLQ